VGYDISRKYTASVRFATASGMPYTPQDERNPDRFSRETDIYSRIDIRFDYRKSYRRFALDFFIEVSNLLDTPNKFVSEEYYFNDGWGFFPLGGIHLSF
jgi:hypothetical protein